MFAVATMLQGHELGGHHQAWNLRSLISRIVKLHIETQNVIVNPILCDIRMSAILTQR